MIDGQTTLGRQHVSILGVAVAAAWSALALAIPPQSASPVTNPLEIMASQPLQTSVGSHALQLLLPTMVFLTPAAPDGAAWLINTAVLWAGAILVGVWAIREGTGFFGGILACLAYMLAPQVRVMLPNVWTTFYLVWFWAVLAGYSGRWKYDLVASVALVGAVLTHPALWLPILAVWAGFRLPQSQWRDWPTWLRVVMPAVLAWLVLPFLWWPLAHNSAILYERIQGITLDPLGLNALRNSGNGIFGTMGATLKTSAAYTGFLLPFVPLAVWGAFRRPELRWPFLALPVIFVGVLLSADPLSVAFLSAPLFLPAAAYGLRALSRSEWRIELPATVAAIVLYVVWPGSPLVPVPVAVFAVAAFFLTRERTIQLP